MITFPETIAPASLHLAPEITHRDPFRLVQGVNDQGGIVQAKEVATAGPRLGEAQGLVLVHDFIGDIQSGTILRRLVALTLALGVNPYDRTLGVTLRGPLARNQGIDLLRLIGTVGLGELEVIHLLILEETVHLAVLLMLRIMSPLAILGAVYAKKKSMMPN